MNLALIGNYGATNVGDDAILESLLKLFFKHQITVFSASPEQTEKQFHTPSVPLFPLGIRSTLKFNFRKSLKALKKADAVVLGGGGLFQDDKLYACFIWAWQVFWVKRLKKPLFICATGVGPLKTKRGKRLTRKVYRYAKSITVRDQASKDLLLELGILEEKIHVTADPTFLFQMPKGVPPPTPSYARREESNEKRQLFISLRPWLGYTSNILESMTAFLTPLKEDGWEFTFVAMQSIKEEDQSLLKGLITKVGGKFFIPKNFSDLLKKMSDADAVVGMRYHFLIAALLTKTPFLALSYSPKVSQLIQNTPLEPYLIPVQSVSLERLSSGFIDLVENYEVVQSDQRKRLGELRMLAEENALLDLA